MTETTESTGTTGSDTTGFSGWPEDALTFLAELEKDNTRAFWIANVHRYRAALLDPTRALGVALDEEFGPPRVFRPHLDRRFRPKLDPYRVDTGLTASVDGGTPFSLTLSTRGLAVQVGYRLFDSDQLRSYRAAVDAEPGEELVDVLARLHGADLSPDGVPALITRPLGCPRNHPRLALMRLRALHVDRTWPAGAWLGTGEPLDRVRTGWRAARPLADWLDRYVGPRIDPAGATEPPPDGAASTADHGSAHSPSPGVVGSVVEEGGTTT